MYAGDKGSAEEYLIAHSATSTFDCSISVRLKSFLKLKTGTFA